MTTYNPIKGITSKITLQAKVAFWKIRLITQEIFKR